MAGAADAVMLPRAAPRLRVGRVVLLLAAAGAVVKVGAWIKEMVLADLFGRSDAMDAVLVALLLPNLLVNLFSESMNQALIPTLVRVRLQQGQAAAQELLSSSMASLLAMLTAAAIAMALLAHALFPFLASGFSSAKLGLSIRLFYFLAPVVVFSGMASNCTAVLNSVERFAIPALAPLLVPGAILAAVLCLHASLGIWSVAVGMVLGSALHAATMSGSLRASGYAFQPRWFKATAAVREVAHQHAAVLLSSIVASAGLLVDQAMAAMLPPGSVSALAYGGRYVSVMVLLLAGAVSPAMVPFFSTAVAQQDWQACRNALRRWPRMVAMVSVPVALAMMAGAHGLVRVTLQHGAFSAADTNVVAWVMAMYAIQIPFFVVSRIFYRFVLALRRADLVLICGGINLALDVVLNLWLMRFMGVAGIALATSLWCASTCALFAFWAHRLLVQAEQNALTVAANCEAQN
jgi:putative peptidoglycan lipid II flippase